LIHFYKRYLTMVQFLRYTSLLIVIQMFALIIAAPQGGQNKDDEKAAMLVIIGCWAENWGDDARQETCRNCFFTADVSTENGMTKSKKCMTDYLPKEAEACKDKVSQLTLDNSETQGEVVLECMGETLKMMGLEHCLSVAGTGNVTDQLTKSSMCMIHSHFEGMKQIKKVEKQIKKITGDNMGKMEPGKRQRKVIKKMWKLLNKAHCDLASDGDVTKTTTCTDCFTTAFKSSEDQIISGIVSCSKTDLGDLYSMCATLLEAGEMENAHQCYTRVLVRDLVVGCIDDSSVVDTKTLENVMKCGEDAAMTWVKKNAKTGLANKIAALIHYEDSEDTDE